MAQNENEIEESNVQNGGEGEKPPSPPKPAEAPKPKPVPTPAAASSATGASKEASSETEEAEGDKMLSLKQSAFKERIDRATSATLKKLFGTDDQAALIKLSEEHKAAKEIQEKQRREQLTREQQLEEDVKKHKAEARASKKRVEELEQQAAVEQEARHVQGLIQKHGVAPKFTKAAFRDFEEFLESFEGDDIEDAEIVEWIGNYLKEFPEHASSAPENGGALPPNPNTGAPPPQRRRVAAANGHNVEQLHKPLPSGNASTKTAAPGRPNSMTQEEYREYKRSRGIST